MSLVAKAGIGPAINKGHVYTMLVILVTGICDAGYQHFNPSTAAEHASIASDQAVEKAASAAAKAAVLESQVTEHTAAIGTLVVSLSDVKTDIAVLKSQGSDAKTAASIQSDKIDRILEAVYRMQGRTYSTPPASPAAAAPAR